jgi:excisionase family DNA binding protein
MALKDTYFTISEAAKALNVSRQTIYRWIADKKIASEKVGGVILVEKKAIQESALKNFFESFSRMMDNYSVEYVRKKCGYKEEDKIVRGKSEKDYLVFLITTKNGNCEKVKVGGMDFTFSVGRNIKGIQVKDITFTDIVKTECEQVNNESKSEGIKKTRSGA